MSLKGDPSLLSHLFIPPSGAGEWNRVALRQQESIRYRNRCKEEKTVEDQIRREGRMKEKVNVRGGELGKLK